ncbi:MAG: hypothetical protein K5872_19025 [Rhizobiaceae bacterium]|nr:hypothetical protein [Rhizobiaceae bacterium]MCV0408321.1 hypothetical protein [Rhizobiaceae bacterium]
MATKPRLDYRDGTLLAETPRFRHVVPGTAVTGIIECRMADPINHGEEPFHIVTTADEIVVAGPFVDGALGAVEALSRQRPGIRRGHRLVRNIPYRFREPGFLRLRLFPIAGLVVAPRAALSAFEFASEDKP